MALRGFMAKRLKFCEQEDTVATAWLMRERVLEKFPLLGEQFMPGCDVKGKCDYHEAESMSEAFGCLFRGCGRHTDPYPYATFNESCSDEVTIAKQSGIFIPNAEGTKTLARMSGDFDMLDPMDLERFQNEG
jgi:hypothetical protein